MGARKKLFVHGVPLCLWSRSTAALAALAKNFWGHNAGLKTGAMQAMSVHRIVGLALRDIERTRVTWTAFTKYCEAEDFNGQARWELLDRQIEQAWATSTAAKALRGAR